MLKFHRLQVVVNNIATVLSYASYQDTDQGRPGSDVRTSKPFAGARDGVTVELLCFQAEAQIAMPIHRHASCERAGFPDMHYVPRERTSMDPRDDGLCVFQWDDIYCRYC
jgi:hypothetical protein